MQLERRAYTLTPDPACSLEPRPALVMELMQRGSLYKVLLFCPRSACQPTGA